MKANQKFIRGDDDNAVSPVIAVILMVAITVVLAATVYVWVSGFGSQSSQPAKTIALTSAGTITSGDKSYTVSAATAGMRWQDLTLTVNGATWTMDEAPLTGATCTTDIATAATYHACAGTNSEAAAGTVDAGDTLRIGGIVSGDTLRILDAQANSVMLTLVIG